MQRLVAGTNALPVLLASLLAMAGAAGADVLETIAIAFVLLPACEAALAAPDAADEDAAPAKWPRVQKWPRATALQVRWTAREPRAATGGVMEGRLLPLLA